MQRDLLEETKSGLHFGVTNSLSCQKGEQGILEQENKGFWNERKEKKALKKIEEARKRAAE